MKLATCLHSSALVLAAAVVAIAPLCLHAPTPAHAQVWSDTWRFTRAELKRAVYRRPAVLSRHQPLHRLDRCWGPELGDAAPGFRLHPFSSRPNCPALLRDRSQCSTAPLPQRGAAHVHDRARLCCQRAGARRLLARNLCEPLPPRCGHLLHL
jgi:hypothetical protein